MSIPSYTTEGRGHNRRVTLTFYGIEHPDRFAAIGAEYRIVRKCRMVPVGNGARCTSCGRVWNSDAPCAGECCKCGAEVV